MKAELNTLSCGREDDLVGFLYGELDDTEQLTFSRHLQDCADCKAQLGSFNGIRESVAAWRSESLGAFILAVEHPAATIAQPRPSALAALREFFNLSPLWMKGTVAFASLLFCLFAVLAVGRFAQTSPGTNVVNNTNSNNMTAQEFNAQVERRVQEELQRREAAQKAAASVVRKNPSVHEPTRHVTRNHQVASPQGKARRPLSKLERQELAADLRLTADEGEAELVLIGDRINQ